MTQNDETQVNIIYQNIFRRHLTSQQCGIVRAQLTCSSGVKPRDLSKIKFGLQYSSREYALFIYRDTNTHNYCCYFLYLYFSLPFCIFVFPI